MPRDPVMAPTEVALRGVAPNRRIGRYHLSFTVDGGQVLRLLLTPADAAELADSLQTYLARAACASQSASSSGNPSVDGSVIPGQSLCPPTRSSSADSALG